MTCSNCRCEEQEAPGRKVYVVKTDGNPDLLECYVATAWLLDEDTSSRERYLVRFIECDCEEDEEWVSKVFESSSDAVAHLISILTKVLAMKAGNCELKHYNKRGQYEG